LPELSLSEAGNVLFASAVEFHPNCARAGLMMSTPADWLMAVVLARQKSLG
jgi:hypothetical protein